MTDAPRFFVNFHSDDGQEWDSNEIQYIPRVGDRLYPYELATGVFEVEEVWELGEGTAAQPAGTHVFAKRIQMQGSKLQQLNPEYYTSS